jgi:hypothetical protein
LGEDAQRTAEDVEGRRRPVVSARRWEEFEQAFLVQGSEALDASPLGDAEVGQELLWAVQMLDEGNNPARRIKGTDAALDGE